MTVVCARSGCGRSLAGMRYGAVWCSNACRMAAQRTQERAQNAHTQPTQADRVLAALAGNPERGITQVDFLRLPTIDGLPPITRLAARVLELREQGHEIVSGETRDRCRVYRLVPAARSASEHPSASYHAGGQGRASVTQRAARSDADLAAGGQLFATGDMEFDAAIPPSHYREEAA